MVYFVNQKKHNGQTDAWDNNAHTKNTYDEAMHQYHAFMSTYAYGQSETLDYVACSVETDRGEVFKTEVDDHRAPAEA